jgi:K+-sensing histidine kinase KdpD
MPHALIGRSAPVRYGFAVLPVAVALLVTLAARHFGLVNRSAGFLAAILLTGWYAGNGPMILAMVLSTFAFDFFFLPPLYTLGLQPGPDPYLVWFLLFAFLAAWFSAARRRSARLLEEARSDLEARVAARTAELRRSEAYLVAAQELSHTGSWSRRVSTGEGYWSEETYRIFGQDPRSPAPNPPGPVDPEVEAVVVRVAQEAITNVVKHADTRTVRVRLSFETRRVRLSIIDDGRGFAVAPDFQTYGGHWGLLGMRERASKVHGNLSLRSTPGHGTGLVLLVPYASGHPWPAARAAASIAS